MADSDTKQLEQIKFIPNSLRRRVELPEELRLAMESPAYWWFRCLQASDEYRFCCSNKGKGLLAKTYEDFGDVFEIAFPNWWLKRGRHLFIQQQPLKKVRAIKDERDLSKVSLDGDRLILEIPLNLRKQTAMRQIGKELKAAYEGRVIDIQKTSTAKIKFVKSRVRMTTVEQLLNIQRIRERHPRLTLYEVGVKAKIELDLFARKTDGEELDEATERRRMTIAVSRLLAQARNLVDNAAHGIFPSLKPLSIHIASSD